MSIRGTRRAVHVNAGIAQGELATCTGGSMRVARRNGTRARRSVPRISPSSSDDGETRLSSISLRMRSQ